MPGNMGPIEFNPKLRPKFVGGGPPSAKMGPIFVWGGH